MKRQGKYVRDLMQTKKRDMAASGEFLSHLRNQTFERLTKPTPAKSLFYIGFFASITHLHRDDLNAALT